jgi:tRNA (guanine37-N1)-methyltransferase
MDVSVVTLMPEALQAYLAAGVVGRARERGLFSLALYNPRDFTTNRHRTVDDTPYGGGPGMVMLAEPLALALEAAGAGADGTTVVMVSPQGRRFDQRMAESMAGDYARPGRRLVILSGRYEGIDQRVVDRYVHTEISVGDYVLSGGELPALVIIDAIVRLLPGVVGDSGSLRDESFSWGILDYPHYTRPPEWRGMAVPEVLAGGNHAVIRRWRRKQALRRTMQRRADLLEGALLDEEDERLIVEIQEESRDGSG